MKIKQPKSQSQSKHPPLVAGLAIVAVIMLICQLVLLIPFSLYSVPFWMELMVIVPILLFSILLFRKQPASKAMSISARPVLALFAVLVILNIASATPFHAQRYADLLPVEDAAIEDYQITIADVPLIDRDSAFLLANRTMGTLVDLVSQFRLNEYVNTQINYQGAPVRVVPLEYDGLFKYINNHSEGIPGYIIVDMSTQKTSLTAVEGGINYSPGAYLGKDLMRHVFLSYPTKMLDSYSFEIDEEGHPFWVVRVVKKTISLFGGTDLAGVILVDAVSGEMTEYSAAEGSIPEWIDTAYPGNLVIEQYDYHGTLSGGFWNSMFGQRNVVETTDGYNYIAMDGDIYLYTGVTSASSDESNIGFIFVNLRTKQTKQYMLPCAEEYSAMSSAEGQVQHLGYTSTFPILVRVAGEPTYCMTLKDAGGLIKQYALVNASQYQIVVTGPTLNAAIADYEDALTANNIAHTTQAAVQENNTADAPEKEMEAISGVISEINTANLNGTTYFYLTLEQSAAHFKVSAVNEQIIFVRVGDTITLEYDKAQAAESIISATPIP